MATGLAAQDGMPDRLRCNHKKGENHRIEYRDLGAVSVHGRFPRGSGTQHQWSNYAHFGRHAPKGQRWGCSRL